MKLKIISSCGADAAQMNSRFLFGSAADRQIISFDALLRFIELYGVLFVVYREEVFTSNTSFNSTRCLSLCDEDCWNSNLEECSCLFCREVRGWYCLISFRSLFLLEVSVVFSGTSEYSSWESGVQFVSLAGNFDD